jgi:hypothetical protein
MIETTLPSPNIGAKGHALRRACARVISDMEISAPNYTSGKHPSADELKAFFDACSTAVAGFVMTVPVTNETNV